MSQFFPIPPDLNHLIEKRLNEDDRRDDDRREGNDRRTDDCGPLGAIESTESIDDLPLTDRRDNNERRDDLRRSTVRRKDD